MARKSDLSQSPAAFSLAESPPVASGRVRVAGGRIAAGRDAPAFTLDVPRHADLPVLIAVPHGGRAYPDDLLARMRAPELCRLRLEDRYIDCLGASVAEATGAALLRAHAPRAMLDLNRAHSDIDWEMIEGPRLGRTAASAAATASAPAPNHRARSGLGLIPRRLPGHGEIWRGRLPRAELDRRIDEVHQPYHAALGDHLRKVRDAWGAALLIDLHSMPPLPVHNAHTPAPVMVLGDRFGASCHHALVSRGLAFFAAEGVPAAQNRPYSGGYVLDRHGAPAAGIHALQIEVCRSLYLDADFAELTHAAADIAALIARLVIELGRETAALGQARSLLEAAE
ncbi:MAG: N-formylglutamate amidohydrolase [Erythrobacter sp.]